MKQIIKTISIVVLMMGSLNVFAFDNKGQVGAVVGGVVGGVVGNQLGGGLGAIVGVIAGAAIGNSVGKSLDRADQQALQNAQQQALYAPVGTPVSWDGAQYGSRTGARGRFETTRRGRYVRDERIECRSYRSEIYGGGRSEVRSGTTCRNVNGGWNEVNSSEVRYY